MEIPRDTDTASHSLPLLSNLKQYACPEKFSIRNNNSKNALESIGKIESGVVNIKGMLNDVSAIDHAAVFWFHSWMWTLTNSGEYFELTLISCLRWSPSPLIIVRRLRLGTKL